MTQRGWLVLDDAREDPAWGQLFDRAVAGLASGGADAPQVDQSYPKGFVIDGQKILGSAVLEYALQRRPASQFDAAAAQTLMERVRQSLGWNDIASTLDRWVEQHVRDPYFAPVSGRTDETWVLRADADTNQAPPGVLRFACDVAIGHLKHGPSYASVSADHIFGWVTALGSDLPQTLIKSGTGALPADLVEHRSDGASAKANDALGVIRITVSEDSEHAYAEVLHYLVRLLTTTDFPRSYSIEFRGPSKSWLPVRGLPKKGVHQLFACAASYPGLHPLIEGYARAAMREFTWYQNLDDANPALPGTFAVFSLACASTDAAPLVLDYLAIVDGEHQSMHGQFVEAYVGLHGFTPESLAYLVACAGNIQHLRHRKEYPALIANRDSLEALLALRAGQAAKVPTSIAALRANLAGDAEGELAFRAARCVIWGEPAERDHGRKVIAAASEDLRGLYEDIFTDEQ